MKNLNKLGILFAIAAAIFSSISTPFNKILLEYMGPTLSGGFLYLGAAIAMIFIFFIERIKKIEKDVKPLTKHDLIYQIGSILFGTAGIISLLVGLKWISASNASLLSNFEIIATSLLAFAVFKEKIAPRLWLGIIFVFIGCVILSVDDVSNLTFSRGSVLTIVGSICWGFENNFSKKLSDKNPIIVIGAKGIGIGVASLVIGFCIGETIENVWSIFAFIGVGIISYGLSLFCYLLAQKRIGAAKTSAFFAVAPFISVVISLMLFKEIPNYLFVIGLVLMIIGIFFASGEKPLTQLLKIKRK